MCEPRRRRSERLVQRQLSGRRRQQVVPTNDLLDRHRRVVDDDRQLISGHAVGAAQDEVVDAALPHRLDRAVDAVDEGDPFATSSEANHRRATGRSGARLDRSGGLRATGPGIAGAFVVAAMGRAGGAGHLGARAGAGIRASLGQQTLDRGVIVAAPLALSIREKGPAHVRAFVPVEAQPAQIVEQHRLAVGDDACGVQIFQPHHEGCAARARRQPRQQRRARVADVQPPGRAGCIATARSAAIDAVLDGHALLSLSTGSTLRSRRRPGALAPTTPSARRRTRTPPPAPSARAPAVRWRRPCPRSPADRRR